MIFKSLVLLQYTSSSLALKWSSLKMYDDYYEISAFPLGLTLR
jgi:hypothetical protein